MKEKLDTESNEDVGVSSIYLVISFRSRSVRRITTTCWNGPALSNSPPYTRPCFGCPPACRSFLTLLGHFFPLLLFFSCSNLARPLWKSTAEPYYDVRSFDRRIELRKPRSGRSIGGIASDERSAARSVSSPLRLPPTGGRERGREVGTEGGREGRREESRGSTTTR